MKIEIIHSILETETSLLAGMKVFCKNNAFSAFLSIILAVFEIDAKPMRDQERKMCVGRGGRTGQAAQEHFDDTFKFPAMRKHFTVI